MTRQKVRVLTAEEIVARIDKLMNVESMSSADLVWETLAVLEAEGIIPCRDRREKERTA